MKKLGVYLLLLISIALYSPVVGATTIDDLVNANDSVDLTEKSDGTAFTFGSNVSLKNKIDGISFVAGNNIVDASKSDYSFIGGNDITINGSTKDLFVAGNIIKIDTEEVKRDVYVAGSNITIEGVVGRNIYVTGENIKINARVGGSVVASGENIEIGDSTVIEGVFKYNDNIKAKISKSAAIKKVKTYKVEEEKEVEETITSLIFGRIRRYVNLLIVGLLLLLIFKKFFKELVKNDLEAGFVIINTLKGLGIVVFFPIAAIIMLITTFGVGLSVISTFLYIIAIYTSSVFTAYYFGKKLLNKKIKNDYLLLVVTLAIIYAVRFIPYLGGLCTAFSLFFGIGILVSTCSKLIKKRK